jgi:hypothetical protein
MLRLKKALVLVLLSLSLVTGFHNAQAQCSVCRTSVENAEQEGGGNMARGINNGILYLMVIPYLFAGVTALILIRMRQRKRLKEDQA